MEIKSKEDAVTEIIDLLSKFLYTYFYTCIYFIYYYYLLNIIYFMF